MPHSTQHQADDHIHLASFDGAASQHPDLHSALLHFTHTIQTDLRNVHEKLDRLTQTSQPPAAMQHRRRARRSRTTIASAPRNFEAVLSRTDPHSPSLIWTGIDFLAALICGFSVTLLRSVAWVHVAGSGWLFIPAAFGRGFIIALLTALATAALSRILHLHDLRPNRSEATKQGLILLTAALSALGVNGTIQLWGATGLHTGLLFLSIALTYTVMSTSRTLWNRRTAAHFKRGIVTRNFVIAGADSTGREVRDYLTSLAYLGYCFKGFVEIDATPDPKIFASQLLGSVNDIIPISRSIFVDEIIFSHRPDTATLIATLDGARTAGIDVRLIPSVSETLQNRTDVHYVGDLPTIVLHQRHTRVVALFFKRILDVVAAAIGIAATSPIWIAVALAVKLTSHGPLFYASNRVGFKGRVFPCYKFRTMVSDAEARRTEIEHLNEREGILFKIANDPRITPVGKFLRKYSLDELPQLWNVLRGDMSMVGPRPPISSEVAQYEIEHLRRLEVTPGITGLWQVEARHKASFESYIELDRAYVSNWSIALDLKILFRTVKVVLMGTGT